MKKLLFALMLFMPVIAFAQDCQYETFEKDEFTGKKVIITKQERVTSGLMRKLFWNYRSYDNKVILDIYDFRDMTTDIFTIRKGNSFMIKLANDEIITLKANESKTSKYGKSSTSIAISLDIDSLSLVKLSSIGIKKIRIYEREEYTEVDISDKGSRIITNQTLCIINPPEIYSKKAKSKKDDAY